MQNAPKPVADTSYWHPSLAPARGRKRRAPAEWKAAKVKKHNPVKTELQVTCGRVHLHFAITEAPDPYLLDEMWEEEEDNKKQIAAARKRALEAEQQKVEAALKKSKERERQARVDAALAARKELGYDEPGGGYTSLKLELKRAAEALERKEETRAMLEALGVAGSGSVIWQTQEDGEPQLQR
jgi:hypothetical protein